MYTDNNPLMYKLTSEKLNATNLRWVGELAGFRFQVKYRPGKSNFDADTLSRMLFNIEDYIKTCCEESRSEVVQASICFVQFQSEEGFPWLTALTGSLTALDDYNSVPVVKHRADLIKVQGSDPVIGRIVYFMKIGTRPSVKEIKSELRGIQRLLREGNKLYLGATRSCIAKLVKVNKWYYP